MVLHVAQVHCLVEVKISERGPESERVTLKQFEAQCWFLFILPPPPPPKIRSDYCQRGELNGRTTSASSNQNCGTCFAGSAKSESFLEPDSDVCLRDFGLCRRAFNNANMEYFTSTKSSPRKVPPPIYYCVTSAHTSVPFRLQLFFYSVSYVVTLTFVIDL